MEHTRISTSKKNIFQNDHKILNYLGSFEDGKLASTNYYPAQIGHPYK
jgi:hypothetical protein